MEPWDSQMLALERKVEREVEGMKTDVKDGIRALNESITSTLTGMQALTEEMISNQTLRQDSQAKDIEKIEDSHVELSKTVGENNLKVMTAVGQAEADIKTGNAKLGWMIGGLVVLTSLIPFIYNLMTK